MYQRGKFFSLNHRFNIFWWQTWFAVIID